MSNPISAANTFFILPDAEAGDAWGTLHVSIAGSVQTISATEVARLLRLETLVREAHQILSNKWGHGDAQYTPEALHAMAILSAGLTGKELVGEF